MKTNKEFSMKHSRLLFFILFIFVSLFLDIAPGFAQDGNPPFVDPNGAWGEVVNPDGSINYANLTDGGVVTQPADWMPSIPGVGPVDAEYHVYTTPSGNTILMPTASTLFFMSANPNESGFNAAATTLGTGGLSTAEGNNMLTGIAGLGVWFAELTGSGADTSTIFPDGNGEQFFNQVLSGETDIYSLGPEGLLNFLTSLANQSGADLANGDGLNLYTYMLLYPPGQCGTVPGGCTPEQLALLQALLPPVDDATPPAPNSCPSPFVTPGQIVRAGTLIEPNYPLVVGQDPDKRGVDVSVNASVRPTIRTSYTPEPIVECKAGANVGGVSNCTMSNGQPGHEKVVGWDCVEHTETYPECISYASAALKLTSESKDWILNELSLHFPGAYLHRPNISMGSSHTCAWTETFDHLQTADPGNWDITLSGQTSGTPVSAPRNFGGAAGQFGVWLKEIAIIK